MGKYADQISAQNKNLSPSQIRERKCLRCKQRNVEKKRERRERAEASKEEWRKLTPEQQLQKLDKRLGWNMGAHKQRKRICEKAGIDFTPPVKITMSGF